MNIGCKNDLIWQNRGGLSSQKGGFLSQMKWIFISKRRRKFSSLLKINALIVFVAQFYCFLCAYVVYFYQHIGT